MGNGLFGERKGRIRFADWMQQQFLTADNEFCRAAIHFCEYGVCDCATEMLFHRIAQRSCAESRMKAALDEKGDRRFVRGRVESLVSEENEFAGNMEAGDVELHIVAEAVEDDLFGDSGCD